MADAAARTGTATPARGRWGVLLVFMGVALVSQMLWLNFAPLSTLIQTRYGVSDLLGSSLVLVFPLLFVVFSVPAGSLIDKMGYRKVGGAGSVLMVAGAAIRIFDGSFWALLAGQVLVGIAQPFVVNGISKLVSDWFDGEEAAMATGLGTMGMFLGMAVGMAATPALVDAAGFRATMIVMAGVSLVAAILYIAIAREQSASAAPPAATTSGLGAMLGDKKLLLLSLLAFLGLGVFNALTTWLEPILGESGLDAEKSGLVGGVMILGGIAGAVVFPLLSDKLKRRKPVLIGCAAPAALICYGLCRSGSYALLLVLGGALGFFFLPAFALLLAMSGEEAGAERAGMATSLLMLAGNGGGVVVSLLVPVVKGSGASYHLATLCLAGLLALTAALGFFSSETFPGDAAPAAEGARLAS